MRITRPSRGQRQALGDTTEEFFARLGSNFCPLVAVEPVFVYAAGFLASLIYEAPMPKVAGGLFPFTEEGGEKRE